MYTLNEKIRDLTPYEPISGSYKIRLDANESYHRIPEYLSAEIAAKLMKSQLNRYPDPYATSLCKAFGAHHGVNPENVVAGNGSDELISVIMNGFLMKGETVASLAGDFSMYSFYAALGEARQLCIPLRADCTVDPELVIDSCKKGQAKLLIFSNPCNPTSLGLEREAVRGIIAALPETLVVLDEAYMDFWDQSLLSEVQDYDNLLILKTCSKAFGLAALRVGFAVGNSTLIQALKSVKSPYNVNTVSQIMAETVLGHRGEIRAALHQILTSKEELFGSLKGLEAEFSGSIRVVSGHTNFIVVYSSESEKIWKYLLDIGIAVRCFGTFLRITAGSHNENVQFVKFFRSYFEE